FRALLGATALAAAFCLAPAVASAQVCGVPPCGSGGGGTAPLSITLLQNMEFGTLAGDGSITGTATIDPSTGTKSVAGGTFDFGGVTSAASFEVKGLRNTPFTIILPAIVTLNSGADSMTLDSFTSNPSGSGILGSSGKLSVTVGATLHVGVNQPAGNYTGIFDVIVNY
ncbi:MAG: DUF4402 domain-containing protein, partial [Desulfuromonadales bacterium]|nr:DUF4402 domain-containing protein [Desulfuromonadales bacterium]